MPAPAPAPSPVEDKSAAEEARRKELTAGRKRKGRATSMLTGGEGLTDTAPTALKTLMGE